MFLVSQPQAKFKILTVTPYSTQNCFVFFRTNTSWPKIRPPFRKGGNREPEPWPIITSLPVRRFLRGFDYLVFDVLEQGAGLLGFMCHFCFYWRGGHKDLAGSTPIPGQNSTSADTCRYIKHLSRTFPPELGIGGLGPCERSCASVWLGSLSFGSATSMCASIRASRHVAQFRRKITVAKNALNSLFNT